VISGYHYNMQMEQYVNFGITVLVRLINCVQGTVDISAAL